MKENQKDSLTTGSQSQQAQNAQSTQQNPTKIGTPSQKQGVRDEEDEEEEQPQAGAKQYDSKEQRDGKTSTQETPSRRDEDQSKTQSQSTDQNRAQNSQQTAEQKNTEQKSR